MQPPYQTPEEAVTGLIEAYRSLDIERIVQNKDFDLDSRLFWQDLGLPVSDEQFAKSRSAFEVNFRATMQNEIPDYRAVSFRFIGLEKLQENTAIVSVLGTKSEKQTFQLKLATIQTENGWKVVRAPGYDHL